LLSLKEGGSEAIVYDRRTLAASQIEDWLEEWTDVKAPQSPTQLFPIDGNQLGEESKRSDRMKHLIAGFFVVAVIMVLGFLGLQFAWTQGYLLPLQASKQAIPIDDLFRVQFSAIVVLFSLIMV